MQTAWRVRFNLLAQYGFQTVEARIAPAEVGGYTERVPNPFDRRSPMMIPLQNLLDDHKCYKVIRQLRWPDGVRCPHCGAAAVTKQGRDTTQPVR